MGTEEYYLTIGVESIQRGPIRFTLNWYFPGRPMIEFKLSPKKVSGKLCFVFQTRTLSVKVFPDFTEDVMSGLQMFIRNSAGTRFYDFIREDFTGFDEEYPMLSMLGSPRDSLEFLELTTI